MYPCSEQWVEAHQKSFLSETNVEITLWVVTDLSQVDSVEGDAGQASFSNPERIVNYLGYRNFRPTLERNLWSLKGQASFTARDAFVGENEESAVTIRLREATDEEIPGLTIVWSDHDVLGYATKYHITASRGGVVVANGLYSNDAGGRISTPDFEVGGYDTISIRVIEWSLPQRRHRISGVYLGHKLVFDKSNLLSYEQEQIGDPNGAEITQNKIRFSLTNFNGEWDLSNPKGIGKYLTERLRVDVRYATSVLSGIEWIPAGTFFLAEWNAPSTGHAITFVAKDPIGFVSDTEVGEGWENTKTTSLASLFTSVLTNIQNMGIGVSHRYERLNDLPFVMPDPKTTGSEIVQMCANAACCLIRYPRDNPGWIYLTSSTEQDQEFTIPIALSYSYPEIILGKPLKEISVSYGDKDRYVLDVGRWGETQTIDNPLVADQETARKIAELAKSTFLARTKLKGSFRSDPRLDVYDIVTVEGKYGTVYPVMLTYIKYTYTGSFKADYEGLVLTDYEEASSCWDS